MNYIVDHSILLFVNLIILSFFIIVSYQVKFFNKISNKIILIFIALIILNIAILYIHYLLLGRLTFVLWQITSSLSIVFLTEPMGLGFALFSSFLWFITHCYAETYMEKSKIRELCFWMSIAMIVVIALCFAGNLITVFILYEILTLVTYPLVKFNKDSESIIAAKKYLMILSSSSLLFFFPAVILTYYFSGNINFLSTKFNVLDDNIKLILLVLYVLGTAKTAIMPLHSWLVLAMAAPFPVSALFHAVVVVKSGIFVLLKIIFYIIGLKNSSILAVYFILIISSITIISAAIIAKSQTNLKKMLAYSTISQLSYSILITAIMSKNSINTAMIMMMSHAFAKIGLFFATGYFYLATNHLDIKSLAGIGKKMPIVTLCFTICSLSIIGIPPFIGFWSKLSMLACAYPLNIVSAIVIAVIIFSSVLSACYFIPVLYNLWFNNNQVTIIRNCNVLPLIVMTFIVIFGGILLNWQIIS